MSKLGVIICNGYLMAVKKRSFIISTIATPFIIMLFILGQIYFAEMPTTNSVANVENIAKMESEITEATTQDIQQAIAIFSSLILWFFLVSYGGMLFNSARYEKSNRIVEIIISSVTPHSFMFGKIVSIGLVGLTQFFIWGASVIVIIGCSIAYSLFDGFDINLLSTISIASSLCFALLSFIGGFLLFGALYTAMGSLIDSDNENQSYMLIITLTLIGAMYACVEVGENPNSAFAEFCTYLPFTSPMVLLVRIGFGIVWWKIIISYLILYSTTILSIFISGKIYAAGILLKGKRVTFSNIIAFIKS